MFDDPPIVCHHDFSQCDLPLDKITKNISFVRPHVKTAWNDWSLVEATVEGIKNLFSRSDKPTWFTLLSGTDYPIKPSKRIINVFQENEFDAHISSKKLAKAELVNGHDRAMYLRYYAMTFKYPSIVHLVQSVRKREWVTDNIRVKNPRYTRYFIPFNDDFVCHMGWQWFSANQKAVDCILEYHKNNPKIANYYKRVDFPDESYFHTILNNAKGLKIHNNCWRYMDWTGQTAHPKTLTMEDLSGLLESDDHFARKFDLNKHPGILDRLDEEIGFKVHSQKINKSI